MANELAVVSFADMKVLAQSIASSGLFGIKKPEEALALMAIAQAEGMHPAIAARDYHIVSGRPTLKADAMLARFQSSGGKVEWLSYTDTLAEATFTHPQGGSVCVSWDMARVKEAGIKNADMYKKYPRQMLRARTVSEGIRTVFPGVVVGMYTPEEISDMEVKPAIEATFTEVKPIAVPEQIEQQPEEIAEIPAFDWTAWLQAYGASIDKAELATDLEFLVKSREVKTAEFATVKPVIHARLLAKIEAKRASFNDASPLPQAAE